MYVSMNKWENVNMKKSGSKNIFVNIILGISMMLSMVGGTFLMVDARQNQLRKAYADATSNPNDNGITFISTSDSQNATGLNGGTYVYNNASINYIDVKGLVYYVKDGKVYTSPSLDTETSDLEYEINGSYVTIGGINHEIKKDIKMFTYKGATCYYKDGIVYDSINCRNSITSDYDTIYTYTYTNGGNTYVGKNTIDRIYFGANPYYKIKMVNDADPSDTKTMYALVKSINYYKLYEEETEGSKVLVECVNDNQDMPTLENILIHSNLPSSGTIVEDYINVFNKPYYIHDNKLYANAYYIDIDKTNEFDSKIIENTNNTITFAESATTNTKTLLVSGVNHTMSEVVINGDGYYIDTSASGRLTKLYKEYTASTAHSQYITIDETNSDDTSAYGDYYTLDAFKVGQGYSYYVKAGVTNKFYSLSSYDEEGSGITIDGVNYPVVNNKVKVNGTYYNVAENKVTIDGEDYQVGNVVYSKYNVTEASVDDAYILSSTVAERDVNGTITRDGSASVFAEPSNLDFSYVIDYSPETPVVKATFSTETLDGHELPGVSYTFNSTPKTTIQYFINKSNDIKKAGTEAPIAQKADGSYELESDFDISTYERDKVRIQKFSGTINRGATVPSVVLDEKTYYIKDGENSTLYTSNTLTPSTQTRDFKGLTIVIGTNYVNVYRLFSPVTINRVTYYVADNDNTNLYIITGDGTANNPYSERIAQPDEFSYTIEKTTNKVTTTFRYQLTNKLLKILTYTNKVDDDGTITKLNIASDYFTYDTQFFYFDNKLYTKQVDDSTTKEDLLNYQMKDFTFSSVVTAITIGNVNYPVEAAEYTTVSINDKQYYVDGNKLYATMLLGFEDGNRNRLITYQDEVKNGFFDYKINASKRLVTIFTGSAIVTDNDTTVTLASGVTSRSTFESDGKTYYLGDDNNIYQKVSKKTTSVSYNSRNYFALKEPYKDTTYYISKTTSASNPENALSIPANTATPLATVAGQTYSATFNKDTYKVTLTLSNGTPEIFSAKKDDKTQSYYLSTWAYNTTTKYPMRLYMFDRLSVTYYFQIPADGDSTISYLYRLAERTTTNKVFADVLKVESGKFYLPNYYIKAEYSETTYYLNIHTKVLYVAEGSSLNPVDASTLEAEYDAIEGTIKFTKSGETTIKTPAHTLDSTDTVANNACFSVENGSVSNQIAEITIDNFNVNFTESTGTTSITHTDVTYLLQDILDLNIEFGFENGHEFFVNDAFNAPKSIKINNTSLKSYGYDSATTDTDDDPYNNGTDSFHFKNNVQNTENAFVVTSNNTFDENGRPNKIYYNVYIRYNSRYYVVYCGTETDPNEIHVYYMESSPIAENKSGSPIYFSAFYKDLPSIEQAAYNNAILKVYSPGDNDSQLDPKGTAYTSNTITFTGFKDFLVRDSYVYNTSDFYLYGEENNTITYNGHDYTIVVDDATNESQLYYKTDALNQIEARQVYFSYTITANTVTVDNNVIATDLKSFKYIEVGSSHFILDEANQVYEKFSYGIHSVTPFEKAGDKNSENAKRVASQVYLTPTAQNYDILNSNNREYLDNQADLKTRAQYENGAQIMLQNYLNSYELQQGNASELGKPIQNVYIQFGEQKDQAGAGNLTVKSGVTLLSVQAFLKNKETAQYSTISEGYDINYGVRIKIDDVRSEAVYYNGQTVINTNYYWFQYFDLKNIKALVGSAIGTSTDAIPISEASGKYTLIFKYSYIDENGRSQSGNEYVYSFYLSDDSNYVEYPTLNTTITEETAPTTEDQLYDVVKKVTSETEINYYYNFQTFDTPIYTFNASRYGVEYDFTYNLDNRVYTTDFKIYNTASQSATNGEYGVLTIYRNGAFDESIKMVLNQANSAIDYYKNEILYGSLYIDSNGKFYLSLENNYYYNDKNRSEYSDDASYYQKGRLIKNGAKSTALDYYFVLVLEELGDYTFKNIRLISSGNDLSLTTSFENYPADVKGNGANNILEGFKQKQIGSKKLSGSETMQFGTFVNGVFYYDKDAVAPADRSVSNTNGKLKIYGVKTVFKKDGVMTSFRKLDDNIYSNITQNTIFKDGTGNDIDVSNKSNISAQTAIEFDQANYYSVPLTNLQPIYFNYLGEMIYSQSEYTRYPDFTYETYDDGSLKSVTPGPTFSTLQFTNKTSINKSGFYVIKVTYKDESDSTGQQVQYFMFVIDNTAPNMQIMTHTSTTDTGSIFVSNNEIASTSRYTNKPYLSVNYIKPTYFQGDVRVSYKVLSYDNKTTLVNETVYNGGLLTTRAGKYVFTIYYGVNSSSYNTTYVVIDKSTPTGELYNVDQSSTNGNASYYYTTAYDKYAFNSPKVFVSNRLKESGAPVSAKIKTITLESYLQFAEQLEDYKAITTNVMIKANIELFDNTSLDDSPAYNFKHPDINDHSLTNGQLLGITDQTTIYVIKLYDSAGNESYYFYFYDTSKPYTLFEDVNTGAVNKTLENNTTQGNTKVIWGDNKAIYVDTTNVESDTNNLYTQFIAKVRADVSKFNGITVNTVNGSTYLYVPIESTVVESENNNAAKISATTSISGSFANNAVIYTTKFASKNNTLSNAPGNWTLVNTELRAMFSGDKTYTFTILDSVGNKLVKRVKMNSSFAQETFSGSYLDSNSDETLKGKKADLDKNRAYTIDTINVRYRALEDNAIFKPKVTYDYYYFAYDQFLTEGAKSSTNLPYSDLAYDLETGSLYKFHDESYYKCTDINEYLTETNATSWDTINNIAGKSNLFVAGYPFKLSTSNQEITTVQTSVTESGKNVYYMEANGINLQGSITAPGLYVFRRVYMYNADGTFVTEEDIENASDDSGLKDLGDDFAVRYYVYYIDRNNIINLTYSDGKVDAINSVGNLLSIALGSVEDDKITSEILKTYETVVSDETVSINTSKLRVKTEFPIDKYASTEKLNALRDYDNTSNQPLNNFAEAYTITRNENIFKYNVTLYKIGVTEPLIKDNVLNTSAIEQINHNYSLYENGSYRLVITDNAGLRVINEKDGTLNEIGQNKYVFNFGIKSESPLGTFQTKADDSVGTIVDLELRDNSNTTVPASGRNYIYKNINKDYLQFSFTQSLSIYDAQVNPFNVRITKNGTQILQTNESEGYGKNEATKFEHSVLPTGVKYEDVISVEGDGTITPKTYTFKIFDRNNTNYLLSSADDNATYKVTLEFIGTASDYLVNSDGEAHNYFTSSFEITVDNIAPENNLAELASKDKNLDNYCLQTYGKTYMQLTNGERSELLKKYVFPISYLKCPTSESGGKTIGVGNSTTNSLRYYAEKDGYDEDMVSAILDLSSTSGRGYEARNSLIKKYSTVFNKNYNDSVKVYLKSIDSNLRNYEISYLPNEEGDNQKLVFNKYDNETYSPYNYDHTIDNMPALSFTYQNMSSTKIQPGYYELFEEDEAGNLTRYLVYVADNTQVTYGIDYASYNQATQSTATKEGLYFVKLNNGNYIYITVTKDATKENTYNKSLNDQYGNALSSSEYQVVYNSDIPTSLKYGDVTYSVDKVYNTSDYTFRYQEENGAFTNLRLVQDANGQFLIYDGSQPRNFTATAGYSYSVLYNKYNVQGSTTEKVVPYGITLITYNTQYCEVYGFNAYDINVSSNNKELDLFKVTALNALKYTSGGEVTNGVAAAAPGTVEEYYFDQFITIKLYSGVKGSDNRYNFTLLNTLVSDPYRLTTTKFMQNFTTILQSVVNENTGVYSYKIEVVNRFGDNYEFIVNLPDANLVLSYATIDSKLQVSLPDSSKNVQITQFNVERYENGAWVKVIRDANGTPILNKNSDDEKAGLPSTRYVFGEGSYRFTIQDNYLRQTIDYKFVGNKDDSMSFDFASKKHIKEGNNYVTSGDMYITLDDSLYEVNIGLRDCIEFNKGDDKLKLSVFSEHQVVNGQVRIVGRVGTFDVDNKFSDYEYKYDNTTTYLLYYYLGKLYVDKNCTRSLSDAIGTDANNFKCLINSEHCYKSDVRLDGKTTYRLSSTILGNNALINDFVFTINWAVDPDNVTYYTLKIDQTKPVITLISENDSSLTLIDGQNYYKEFAITWSSNYNSKGYLTITKNAVVGTPIEILPLDRYTIREIGGYTLKIVDDIGNEVNYSFNMISSGNTYFSVFVDGREIFESDYASINDDGKVVKYYYYLIENGKTPNIVVKPDATRGIDAQEKDSTGDYIKQYEVKRQNINYTICYVNIIGVSAITNTSPNNKKFINQVAAYKSSGEITKDATNHTYGQEYTKVTLTLESYYTPNETYKSNYIGNKIFASHYYNGTFVKTYSATNLDGSKYSIDMVATGIHTFEIHDLVGNKLDTLTITLIRDVMFNVNSENPIENRFYNGNVIVNIPEMPQFYSNINLVAVYNGVTYKMSPNKDEGERDLNNIASIIRSTNTYTFKDSGYYEITITADKVGSAIDKTTPYSSTYRFTIVNPNVMKMTFGFSSSYGFNIEKVLRNNLDITDTLSSLDSLWITSGQENSAGLYTITLTGFDTLTNEYLPFSFNFRINNEVPAITPLNYSYGTSTTKNVTLQYNGALIYSQVGESYIEISNNGVVQGKIDINAESTDELSTITIGVPGKWTITIYNNDGNFIASYTINRATPLNSSARLIIIIAVVVFIALVVAFIILRKHTKFR